MAIALSVPGYARLKLKGARGLVIEACRSAIEAILSSGTLYEYASRQPDTKKFRGRTTAYGVDLGAACGRAVVRHAMRGGLLGKTGSDLFLPPTRGLRELVNSLRLRVAGVPTPEIIAFVSYPAGRVFRRSDVATREIPDSHDLAVVLREISDPAHRDACLSATGTLLALLARAGAHHPDLNARNVLISWERDGARAHVLDVDRIRFHVPADPMVSRANLARLERSLDKLREREDLAVSPRDVELIRESAAAPVQ